MVKVRILKHVGPHKPGDEVEVPDEQAKFMCEPRMINTGGALKEHRVAISMEEYEALKELPFDKGGLSQGELAALGGKNIVETPHDPLFEEQLAGKQKGLETAAAKKAAKAAAAKEIDDHAGIEDLEDGEDLEGDEETGEESEESEKSGKTPKTSKRNDKRKSA